MEAELKAFESYMDQLWADAMASDFIKNLPGQAAFQDKRLVAIYLTQVYHYAVHTPRHQAVVAVNPKNTHTQYMQYCFEHALEETGHELMALKDIQSLGFEITVDDMPPALPSTQLLIAYLYRQAQGDHPVHHLGYGFWSENACPFINEFMQNLMESMGLNRSQMTFYSGHVTIDESHAREVREIIKKVALKPADWKGMRQVAKVTFDLTVGIVNDTINTYNLLANGDPGDFKVLA